MKDKIITFLFVGCLVFFFIGSIFIPDKKISFTERRTLSKFPNIELSAIVSKGSIFFDDVNDYLTDHFPFRDWFRSIKGKFSSLVFRQFEDDGILIHDDGIYQIIPNIDKKSVSHFTKKLTEINDKHLKQNSVYFAVIPDKNYYLNYSSILKLNYEELNDTLKESLLEEFKFIDLYSSLNLDSYYKTDIHWKQESLESVVSVLRENMGLESFPLPNKEKTYSKFYGALYGRIASSLKPDTITYLYDSIISSAKVYNYEKQEYQPVYQDEYFKNVDSYDVFLSGATPLLVIENEQQTNGKELILFRDSFGSSLAPLLISNYSKITLIDLRYFSSSLLASTDIIDFSNSDTDILFLYSVPIINESYTLK